MHLNMERADEHGDMNIASVLGCTNRYSFGEIA